MIYLLSCIGIFVEMEHFDNNVKYRASLQNYVIDTGDDVILVDTGLPKETPGAVWGGKAHSYMGRWIEDYSGFHLKSPDGVLRNPYAFGL